MVFKKLKHEPVTFNDLREIDEDVYKNLEFISNYEGDLEDLGLNFQVIYTIMDESHTYLLKEKGDQIPVTQKNKDEYIQLYTDWYLNKSIQVQYKSFENGFNKVVGGDVINVTAPHPSTRTPVSSRRAGFFLPDLKARPRASLGPACEQPTSPNFWSIVRSILQTNFVVRFLPLLRWGKSFPRMGAMLSSHYNLFSTICGWGQFFNS